MGVEMNLKEYIQNYTLIADGSMGTYYASLGQKENVISEWGNINQPELIERIHREYIQAGARLIRTNTFAANKEVLSIEQEELSEIIRSACKIAQTAVQKESNQFLQEEKIYIAGSIGPIPEKSTSEKTEILKEYQNICDIFIEENLPVILFETFPDFEYIHPLAKYIRKRDKEVAIIANFCFNKHGYTRTGLSGKRLLQEISKIDEIDGCGFNCGIGSGHMYENLRKLPFPMNKFMVSMPNAGYPEQFSNRMVFEDNINYFQNNMKQIAELGIDMIGGCCGTTPEYIQGLKELTAGTNRYKGVRVDMQAGSRVAELYQNEFYELFSTGRKVVAVELDPPFDAEYDKIISCAEELKRSGADIITIADSPMGRSRADSILMSVKIQQMVDIPVMPHVCCRDKNMIAMRSGLLGAYIHNIRNLLVVTGDPVPSDNRTSTTGVFDYNSMQLMRFIQEMNQEHFAEAPIYYGGALNYGRGKIEKVIERMERKIEAGAKFFLSQPIYAKEDVERIAYIKEHVDTKILCGIMPLVSYRNANFIKNEIAGIHVPDEIVNRYHPDMTREEAQSIGTAIANETIEELSPYADGYYFMLPFNRTSFMKDIVIK